MTPHENVRLFLYLLMRDVVPTGKVAKLLDDTRGVDVSVYSSPELAALANRYAGVLLDDIVDAEIMDEEESPIEAVERHENTPAGGLRLTAADGGELSGAMLEFLDRFDERIIRQPFFIAAVNEAAAMGVIMSEDSAQAVYHRAQEMAQNAKEQGAPGDA